MKDKKTAALLAILIGGVGAHRFYLGQNIRGLGNIFFMWTFIPAIAALINGIIMFQMSDELFDMTYNQEEIEKATMRAEIEALKNK